jgi:hypothetical protein
LTGALSPFDRSPLGVSASRLEQLGIKARWVDLEPGHAIILPAGWAWRVSMGSHCNDLLISVYVPSLAIVLSLFREVPRSLCFLFSSTCSSFLVSVIHSILPRAVDVNRAFMIMMTSSTHFGLSYWRDPFGALEKALVKGMVHVLKLFDDPVHYQRDEGECWPSVVYPNHVGDACHCAVAGGSD